MADVEPSESATEPRESGASGASEAVTAQGMVPARRAGWRSWITTALKLVVGFGLLAYLVLSGRLQLSTLARVGLGWEMAAAAALIVGALLLPCIRWQLLLRYQGLEVPFRRAVKLTWIGYFFGLVLPGAVSGDLVRGLYIVRDNPRARAKAASTVIVDRGLGLYSLFFIGLAPAVALVTSGQGAGLVRGMSLFTVAVAVVLTSGLLLFCHPESRRRCLRLMPSRVRDQAHSILSNYCSRPRGLLLCFAISLGANLLNVIAFVPAALVLREKLSFLSALLVGPLVILANSLPISPGGLGVAESTASALLDAFGFAAGAEVMLLLRAILVSAALPGALLYITDRGSRADGR